MNLEGLMEVLVAGRKFWENRSAAVAGKLKWLARMNSGVRQQQGLSDGAGQQEAIELRRDLDGSHPKGEEGK